MHIFRISDTESVSDRWTEAFPDARIERPPFASPAQPGSGICWISSAVLEGWADLVRGQVPHSRVVVISRTPTDEQAIEALDAGAHGYCHALSNAAILRSVANTVGAGSLWVGPGVISRMIRTLRHSFAESPDRPPEGFETLTPREREVALAVTTGASNKEIAEQLGMTERTVKMHMGTLFRKLGVRDRVHLVLYLARPAGDSGEP
jgi:two-component system, NarL family, nitrate/nitrite response regulator NarL